MSLRFKSLKHAQEILGDRVLISLEPAASSPKTKKPRSDIKLTVEEKMSPPHRKLWSHVKVRLSQHNPVPEFTDSVPGRRFRLDIAFPEQMLAIEVDGHKSHGKHRAGFEKDREKQNLLTLNGWRVLRFSGREIRQNIEEVISTIEGML